MSSHPNDDRPTGTNVKDENDHLTASTTGANDTHADGQNDLLFPTTIPDIFRLIVRNSMPHGLKSLIDNGGRHFSIITLCSGTDAPILSIRSIQEACIAMDMHRVISADHICSVEIEPVKQAFIRRNIRPTGHIFRDVVDFAEHESATTAAGFKAKVPTNVDLLVVGSSCVDFSTLNTRKQNELYAAGLPRGNVDATNPSVKLGNFLETLQDTAGESATTFLSSLKYILKVRPKLVVLENVNAAPWETIAGQYFPMAGYHAVHISVDSKEYGVPQTRQRGYCVAADSLHYGDFSAVIVKEWARIVRAIAPRTQIPLQNLLLRPGDREVREMEIPIERGGCREPSAKATMCKMRHKDAREMFNIPDLNPMSGVDDRGVCRPDDRIFGSWLQRQGTRVCDLLDISWMRILNQLNFDARYKLHIIDLSQNVDRSLGQVGQAPCVTPAGIQFLTGQGRPLLGSEALALQGIDSSKLVPSTESEKDWRDLAGNAMTTTVVASAILAAIVAEWNVCKDTDLGLKEPARDVVDDFRGEGRADCPIREMQDVTGECHQSAVGSFATTVRRLVDLYKHSRSYCRCDGLGIRNRAWNLLLCRDCSEIRCKFCAGNPQHNFDPEPLKIDFKLHSRAETTQLLGSLFPPTFTLTTDDREDGLHVPTIDSFSSTRISTAMEKAFIVCCNSVTYFYDGCHVGQDLTVFYTSSRSFAHVVISATAVTWTIYMDVPKCRRPDPGEDTQIPCLRAVMNKADSSHIPSKQDWLLWVDDRHEVEVEINKDWDREFRIKYDIISMRNGAGSGDVDPRVSEAVNQALAETYELTEKCGASHAVLFIARDLGLFHMMQPDPSKPATDDRFVIAKSNRVLELFERREPLLLFPANFRPKISKWERISRNLAKDKENGANEEKVLVLAASSSQGNMVVRPCRKGGMTTKEAAIKSPPVDIKEPKPLLCEVPGLWVSTRQHSNEDRGADVMVSDDDSPPSPEATAGRILLGNRPLQLHRNNCDRSVPWLHIRVPLKDISWRNEAHRSLWKPDFCTPKDDDDDILMVPQPVECRLFSVSTHNHDDLLKNFAFAFKRISLLRGPSSSGEVDLPQDLCRRCVPEVPTLHRLRNECHKVVQVVEDITECETFERNINERPPPFKIYVGMDHDQTQMTMHVELNLSALCHRAAGHLPREGAEMGVRRRTDRVKATAQIVTDFIDSPGIFTPFAEAVLRVPENDDGPLNIPSFDKTGNKLWPNQMPCVRWMLKRERDPAPFIEAEVEEHHERQIGLRLVGRATNENWGRGGVVAHEVGFGKTVVTLALLDHERGRIEDSINQRRMDCGEGLIHSKATLIIVPHHIVDQWRDEVRRLVKRQVIANADIIIASIRAVKFNLAAATASKGLQRLATVSGQPQMHGPDNSRNYHDFVSKCCRAMREIFEAKAQDASLNVADEIAARLAFNQGVLHAAEASHVPPSGRGKKSNARKIKVVKALKADQASDTDVENTPNSAGGRPSKAKKTNRNGSAPKAANGSDADNGEVDNDAGKASTRKRKTPAAAKGKRRAPVKEETAQSYYEDDGSGIFLESLSFTRLVLDEFSYEDHEVETFVRMTVASSKWLLSGTPPLTKLSSVCSIASMLNVHVARVEPALPLHLHEVTEGPSCADMSASEGYRALRQLKTTTFAFERHQQGQEFIRHFMRRNEAADNKEYEVIKRVVFVPMDTPVIAHYLRLQHCLFAARWDVQGLSLDGNELLKPIIEVAGAKTFFKDESQNGRLDAAIQALLLHTTLPSIGFNASSVANTPGITILDSLTRLVDDAKLSYQRLCSTFKSQFDRLMFLVDEFPEMEDINVASREEVVSGEVYDDYGGNGAEEDSQAVEGEGEAPRASSGKTQKRQNRDRKFRQAKRYLDSLVSEIVHQKEPAVGGQEILNLLRTTLLADRVDDAKMELPENWLPSKWQKREGGPGTNFLVDWYPEIHARLLEIKEPCQLPQLKLLYRDCACALDRPVPDTLDTMSIEDLKSATRQIIEESKVRRCEQFGADDVEMRSGLTGGTLQHQMLRMQARKIGLKCLLSDTIDDLKSLLAKHKSGGCTEKYWEFGMSLPQRFPLVGVWRHLRGTDVEDGLEDLTWVSQSATGGAYEKIPEAYHRFRFLTTLRSLSLEQLDGRTCDGCAKTGVLSSAIEASVGCDHKFCEDCGARNSRMASDHMSWCKLCRGNGETVTMLLAMQPYPRLFCHSCETTQIRRPSDAYVLPTCGHLLCSGCISHLYANPPTNIDGSPALPRCNARRCNYPVLDNDIRGDKLVTKAGSVLLETLGFGGKLQKMVDIVDAAKKKGEKVLVFVPYAQQLDGVEKCLADANFSVGRTDTGTSSANALQSFQGGTGDVLLQRLNSSDSAGSNLTIANHVIFIGSLFSRDQRSWQMVVDQAVGRCDRPGQKKTVHVYHLVAENSLDVDVLEHHMKAHLEPDENGEVDLANLPTMPKHDGPAFSGQKPSERGSLLQPAELELLFRKIVDYNDTDNLF
ncbi:uncharacterized protein DNG_09302 [Cephalotrichum gorgonifer]|uniref:Helicase C-terminal domain-containing protein n=1 Tax=Cephalotrichum gorgonifer TaxID=2041049 RepID=A0AAE8N812_9PEZI|nr:uncharacterized protein DNG_09302 [Cephalotrichum gorgonifer]